MFAVAAAAAVILLQSLMAQGDECATGRVRGGANLRSAILSHKIEPVSPPLAIQARIHGAVRFHVLVSKTGVVEIARLEAGHPFLVEAALDAVRQYRYEPATWCGHPIPEMKLVDVLFTLKR